MGIFIMRFSSVQLLYANNSSHIANFSKTGVIWLLLIISISSYIYTRFRSSVNTQISFQTDWNFIFLSNNSFYARFSTPYVMGNVHVLCDVYNVYRYT